MCSTFDFMTQNDNILYRSIDGIGTIAKNKGALQENHVADFTWFSAHSDFTVRIHLFWLPAQHKPA